jgi:hypothetical protein
MTSRPGCAAAVSLAALVFGGAGGPRPALVRAALGAPLPEEGGSVLARRRWRRVVTVAGPTQADLVAALQRAGSSSIVVVPAGRYPISGTVDIPGDDVLLVGAGAGPLAGDGDDGEGTTVFLRAGEDAAHAQPMVRARGRLRVEVSGIRFAGVAAPGSRSRDVGVLLEDCPDFRVDHCAFDHLGFAGVRVNGASRGVVDHSTFRDEYKAAIATDGYGVAVYGAGALLGVPFGDDSATFIEDSRFARCRHAVSSNQAARYVFRHNLVRDGVVAHAVDAHGTEYGSAVGTEWIDVHDNTLEQDHHEPPFYDGFAVRIRGGQGLVHDNVVRGYRSGVELTELTSQTTGPVYVWSNNLPPDSPALHGSRAGHKAQPVAVPAAPTAYRPSAYPHPLVSARCRGPGVRAGWATVCPVD